MEANLSKVEVQAIKYTMYTTLYLNDLAVNAIKDLKPYFISKEGVHKESKKMYKALLKKVDAYNSMIKEILGEYAEIQSFFFSEMDNKYDELIENLYNAIYEAIYPFLGEDTEEISKCEIATILCELAVVFHKIATRSCEQYSKKVHRLNYLRIDAIYDNCKNLDEWVGFLYRNKINLDLNKVPEVIECFDKLRDMVEDPDSFSNSVEASFKEYKAEEKRTKKNKRRVMVKLNDNTKEFYESIADCAKFFKVSPTTIVRYAKDNIKFKGIFTIKIID